MIKNKMKPQLYRIAAFPLNIVVLPGEEVPLRIFEPRYKQLINECMEYSLPFGIPYMSKGIMTEIGSEVEVVNIIGRNDIDDMVIMIKGKSIFKTKDFFPELPNKMYGGIVAEAMLNDFGTTNPELAKMVKTLKLNLSPDLGTLIISNEINMLDVARSLMLKSEEKYKVLTINDKKAREQFIINRLRFVELIKNQEKKLENNFQLN